MSAILKALQNRKVEVELKSEVVEFGLIDNARAINDNLSKSFQEFKKSAKELESLIKKVEDKKVEVKKDAEKLTEQGKKISKMEKDLGITDRIGEQFIEEARLVNNQLK